MMPELEIVEHVGSTWHYHLRLKGERLTLCGLGMVMHTNCSVEMWGRREQHIPSYCRECDRIKREVER